MYTKDILFTYKSGAYLTRPKNCESSTSLIDHMCMKVIHIPNMKSIKSETMVLGPIKKKYHILSCM